MRPTEGLLAGRYTLGRVIGHGATATVHIARDERTGGDVAIKLLRPELAQSAASDRFLKEIERTSALQHPRILTVLDSGDHDGQPFFVLPYMEGGTLRTRLKKESQLQIGNAIAIAKQVAEALDHAHARGLIHRDIKPENILFSGGVAYVGDFGIARALQTVYGDGTTSSATIRGTPAYMSPEQAAGGEDLDQRSDEYSLACVVYEMITGMQAFMGPTPESVMAQRFQHTPREIKVYRATAPSALDSVLLKAFSISRADRYASCGEFVAAMEAGAAATDAKEPFKAIPPWRRRGPLAIAALGVVLSAAIVASADGSVRSWLRLNESTSEATPDSTHVAVIPFSGDTGVSATLAEDLVQSALMRLEGLTAVDRFLVADAVRQHGLSASYQSAASVARSLGAGRFIRGQRTQAGDSVRLAVALFSVLEKQPIYSAVALLGPRSGSADSTYDRLVTTLFLRRSVDLHSTSSSSSRSIPARQAFLLGMAALSDWDLTRSDSLLQASLTYDRSYAEPALWLGLLRSWGRRPRESWRELAEVASDSTAGLRGRELQLARGLASLGRGEFTTACRLFVALRTANPRDFAAWFGNAQCHDLDRVVVRDSNSPTGWRYRSSYAQAVDAYSAAYKLLPSSLRSLQNGAFEALRNALFTDLDLRRPGVAADDASKVFLSRALLQGDSLVFYPAPLVDWARADSSFSRTAILHALDRQRRVFLSIARGWSVALPSSAGAKEAVAVGLEMLGDPTAVDTLRVARALAGDVAYQRRLAATEVLLTIKFAFPDDTQSLRNARRLADSLLVSPRNLSQADYSVLAPIALVAGRCKESIDFARAASTESVDFVAIPQFLVAQANALLAATLLQCPPLDTKAEVLRLRLRLREVVGDDGLAESALLAPVVRAALSPDSALLEVFSGRGTELFRAQQAALRGDKGLVRRTLAGVQQRRWPLRTGGTADAFYPEARLWLSVGDTAAAREHLDSAFVFLRRGSPVSFAGVGVTVARVGSLLRAVELRALIASPAERGGAARWRVAMSSLTHGDRVH